MSLRWRVALALAALAAAATFASGLISYTTTRTRLYEEVDRGLAQATEALPPMFDDPRNIPERGPLQDVYVQLLDRRGQLFLSAGGSFEVGDEGTIVVGRPGEVRYETVTDGDVDLRVRTEGVRGGAVQVARNLDDTASVLDDLRRRTALLVVSVTGLAAMVGWFFARSMTAPLARLTRAATDVERSGRLDVAVPVKGRDEVGRLGEAFNGMLGALATSRADQQRLVEDAGHELRTPLTSVRTNLAVLRRHGDLDAETRDKVLADIHTETEELVVLVEEIVALARGDTDESADVDVQLGDVARTIATRAERRHERLVIVVADTSAVHGQRSSIERAISNLVDNACKFDRSGGPVEIHIASGRLVVHDRGPGLVPGDETKVFDRFYRAERARAEPGSGLGLSIVQQIVDRLGGSAFASNRPGGGASVGFQLSPVAPCDGARGTVDP